MSLHNNMPTKKLFISVGSRFTMDRLISTVDEFLDTTDDDYEIIAQVGNSTKTFKHINVTSWLTPEEFNDALINCDVFISHAGMGNILLAAEHKKPIIVMPRTAQHGEHINNHQLGTVKGLQEQNLTHVIETTDDLKTAITIIDKSKSSDNNNDSSKEKRNNLVVFLGQYLNQH